MVAALVSSSGILAIVVFLLTVYLLSVFVLRSSWLPGVITPPLTGAAANGFQLLIVGSRGTLS